MTKIVANNTTSYFPTGYFHNLNVSLAISFPFVIARHMLVSDHLLLSTICCFLVTSYFQFLFSLTGKI